jgi:proline iminopeptidase
MRHILRAVFACLMALTITSLTYAQDGNVRAEFDCLTMATSSNGMAFPGDASLSPSYHHVWTPGLSYGYFRSNGVNLLYETEGMGSEVVIVVHGGAGLPHEYFHPMLSNLSRYAKLVYFDRRADMLSRKSSQTVSIDEMSDDLDSLRQALGLNRVTLFGHSFGASIAINYALRHPQNVKRLILVSAGPAIENPAEAEKRIAKTLTPAEMASYQSSEGGTGAANPCERVRRRYGVLYPHYFYKKVPYEFDRGVYTAYFDALSKRLALASDPSGFDVRARLKEVKVPVMVVAGRHDLVTTLASATELAEGLPSSRLVVMDHSGHFPFFEENYMFTEWVRQFIAGTNDNVDDRKTSSPVRKASGSR